MILVTGGSGLVGSYLIRQLLENGETQIRAIKRTTSDLSLLEDVTDKIEWIEGDVMDILSLEEAFKDVSQLYHCAAIVSYDPKDRQKMMRINAEGTANVVNVSLEKGISKMVHVSSIAALGRTKKVEKLSEKTVWSDSKYNSNYGISKFLSENEVWRGIAEGLNAVIVNPSIILGAGKWGDTSTKLFKEVANGLKFYPPGVTGYVDVRDVVKIMIHLMNSEISGQRYILNAENITFYNIFSQIAECLDKNPPSIKVQKWMVKTAYPFLNMYSSLLSKQPLISKEMIRNLGNEYYYSNNKVKDVLDYEFLPVKKSIEDICKVYKKSKLEEKEYGILSLK